MPTVTAQGLRDLVGELIAGSIEMHRGSREYSNETYVRPSGDPNDDEIDDFLLSNPILDLETVSQLTNPGLLGFSLSTAHATEEWLAEFRENVAAWASTKEWEAADLVSYHVLAQYDVPEPERRIWTSQTALDLSLFSHAPNHLLLAEKLLRQGRLLSEMGWREFEKLIGEILESQGWTVTVMRGTKDGGIDVLSEKHDDVLGTLRAIWQAKKYGPGKKVTLNHLRELSAVVERDRATKGIIVTTSSFTGGAIDWVHSDKYRLDAKDGKFVEKWVRSRLYET
ncbi:Restriction endonuclease [Paraburkholderia steynii]|uniref:Restriction endonuclease n=1 Tax=Paraburkholderia steynii TaxID=1245441 RepID=A0A7Z7BDW6_9BURK|nr:restriction endonuclease [Paraburkholderia steynii]SDI94044.1 Restriction endonuclease [Paraburkholderia steynii]